jgi:hypothetical protein
MLVHIYGKGKRFIRKRQPLSVKLKIKLLACSSKLSKKLYQNVRGEKSNLTGQARECNLYMQKP